MSTALLGSFLFASALLVVSPGPGMLFILRQSQIGAAKAFAGLAGIVLADVALIACSCLGVAAVVARFPALAATIKLAGGAYVAWIGWQIAKAGIHTERRIGDGAGNPLAQGLLITLSNPKAILFFAAFFPLFTRAGVPAATQFAELGLIFECVNIALYSVFIASWRRVLTSSQHVPGAAVSRLCGGGLLLAGSIAAIAGVRDFV